MSEEAHPGSAPAWFREPPEAHRTAAFWFWHRLPTPAEIRTQIADFADKGLATLMVQARLAFGLADYMGLAFLDACRLTAEAAKAAGIGIEIYDEFMWMSGHGGGRTVEGAGHLKERHVFFATVPVIDGAAHFTISEITSPFLKFLGEAGRNWAYENGMIVWDDWEPVAAIAHPALVHSLSETTTVEPRRIRLAGQAEGCAGRIESVDTDGFVTVFVAARCASSRLVNYLVPEAADRFAATIYEPLLAAFGPATKGFFFDHPYAGFYTWRERTGDLGNSLLFDARLPFFAPEMLLSLIRDVGPQTAALRCSFFADYAGAMHEAFFGTLSRWTAARGLGFSGHELLTHVGGFGLHDGLAGFDPRVMPGTDYFGIDAYRTATTVDAADYAPQLSAKLGDSVARSNGRTRCTVEQYSTGREAGRPGLSGQWDLTLERLRAQSVRHLLFGARRILLHAVCLTETPTSTQAGIPGLDPRLDFPPGHNFEPWWEDCPAVLTELARLSAFLEAGEPVRPVALLYPLATIRIEAVQPDCGRHFGWWAEALARAGIGHDIVDERQLAAARVADGALTLQGRRYDTLILPAVTTLASNDAAETIAAFAVAGGHVVASGPLPFKSATGGDEAIAARLSSRFSHPSGRCRHMPDAGPGDIAAAVATFRQPLPAVAMSDGPTWATVARTEEGHRLAVFNDADGPRTCRIEVGCDAPLVTRWHPATGEATALAAAFRAGTITLSLEAHELLCLSTGEGWPIEPPRSALSDTPPVALAEGWTFRRRDIDAAFRPIAVDRGWERQGLSAFSGTGIYRRRIDLPPLGQGLAWDLVLPYFTGTAVCRVDGTVVGRHVAGTARFALPAAGTVMVEIEARNTAANRYRDSLAETADTLFPSGLVSPPRLEARIEG